MTYLIAYLLLTHFGPMFLFLIYVLIIDSDFPDAEPLDFIIFSNITKNCVFLGFLITPIIVLIAIKHLILYFINLFKK